MPSSSLLNIPRTEEQWAIWSFNHAQQHVEIIQAVKQDIGTDLSQYQLDPINFTDIRSWLERHQQTHVDMNVALNLQSIDLQQVDLKDENQLNSFIYYNWLQHITVNQLLGI